MIYFRCWLPIGAKLPAELCKLLANWGFDLSRFTVRPTDNHVMSPWLTRPIWSDLHHLNKAIWKATLFWKWLENPALKPFIPDMASSRRMSNLRSFALNLALYLLAPLPMPSEIWVSSLHPKLSCQKQMFQLLGNLVDFIYGASFIHDFKLHFIFTEAITVKNRMWLI